VINDPDDVNLERTLMHESMHLFGGLGALGERSHGDAPGRDEADLDGLPTGRRLSNADSYAALAIRLAKAGGGLRASAEHFRGADLALVTTPRKTTLHLADAPDTFTVLIDLVRDLAPTMQWRLTDAAGRHYLLLNLQDEVVDPTTATDSTLVKLGRRTRDLLRSRVLPKRCSRCTSSTTGSARPDRVAHPVVRALTGRAGPSGSAMECRGVRTPPCHLSVRLRFLRGPAGSNRRGPARTRPADPSSVAADRRAGGRIAAAP
jgi:hypothetical protein